MGFYPGNTESVRRGAQVLSEGMLAPGAGGQFWLSHWELSLYQYVEFTSIMIQGAFNRVPLIFRSE